MHDNSKPCAGENANICVAEGCFGESCLLLEGRKVSAEEDALEDRLQTAIGDAISRIIDKETQTFVIKWVVAVEVMHADGERGVWSIASPDNQRWDIYGLLKELEMYQMSYQVAEHIKHHDE